MALMATVRWEWEREREGVVAYHGVGAVVLLAHHPRHAGVSGDNHLGGPVGFNSVKFKTRIPKLHHSIRKKTKIMSFVCVCCNSARTLNGPLSVRKLMSGTYLSLLRRRRAWPQCGPLPGAPFCRARAAVVPTTLLPAPPGLPKWYFRSHRWGER